MGNFDILPTYMNNKKGDLSNKNKLLVFHTKVAPYRVDFFNNLALHYDLFMCMDRKQVYGGLYKDVEESYRFEYIEELSTKGIIHTGKFVFQSIRQIQPDIVMVSECGLISLVVVLINCFIRRKFSIVSIVDDSYDQLILGRHFSKRHIWAEKMLIPRFNQIINVDERVSVYFNNKYGKGVSFPIIRDEEKYRNLLFKALPISKDYMARYTLLGKKVILFVGRFVWAKNIPFLIQVFTKLKDNNVKLVLVGSGEDEKSLVNKGDNNNIIFTGALSGDQLYAWYNIADVFVLPSLIEPFGAVTNEALMAGCQCLVSERAGSSCLIKKGVNGDCFNPLDEVELLNKLKQLLTTINGKKSLERIRPNLMLTTFKSEMDKVITCLDNL